MYFGSFKSTGPDFCPLQPWQCSCHDMAQQWQFPWGSRQCPLEVFKPPWTSRGTGEPSALPIGHWFQTPKEGGACDLKPGGLMNTDYKVGGTLLSSPSPLPLCPALAAGSRNFPFPTLFLLIFTIFSMWILTLILLLLQLCCFLLIPRIP